jgi:hypothetical protein
MNMGCLADQEGVRDFLDGQARYDAQGECDLLGRRQVGMAEDEEGAEYVVASFAFSP